MRSYCTAPHPPAATFFTLFPGVGGKTGLVQDVPTVCASPESPGSAPFPPLGGWVRSPCLNKSGFEHSARSSTRHHANFRPPQTLGARQDGGQHSSGNRHAVCVPKAERHPGAGNTYTYRGPDGTGA
jgi:hypothetical protein